MTVLLLTGTIAPSKDVMFLNVIDPQARYKQYISAISQYITLADCSGVVFCENSGFPIADKETLEKEAKFHNKKLEIIQFQGNHKKSIEKGRGYGENEIIEYAITHSELIKQAKSFIKITGRYRCKNINSIIHGSEGKYICFSKLMPYSLKTLNTKAINTAIFKCTPNFFQTVLAGAGNDVDDTKIHFLEHVYYDRLLKHAKEIHSLPVYPLMTGITGQGTILKKTKFQEYVIYILHKLGLTKLR